jgi:hypothetical protein
VGNTEQGLAEKQGKSHECNQTHREVDWCDFRNFVTLWYGQVGWGIYREPIAKKQAEDFCATHKIAQSVDGIAQRSIDSDAEE